MFDRFTDRARKAINLARQEAQRLNHEYIGTEHILLGLVQEGNGVAANVLKNLGIDLQKARQEVEKIVKTGPNMVTMGKLPLTPKVQKVLELALEEMSNLGHNYVGTEHILLGMIKEHDGKAAKVLQNLGVKLETVRKEVLKFLGVAPPKSDDLTSFTDLTSLASPDIIGKTIEVEVLPIEGRRGATFAGMVTGYAQYEETISLAVALPLFVGEFLAAQATGWVLSICRATFQLRLRALMPRAIMGNNGPIFDCRLVRIS